MKSFAQKYQESLVSRTHHKQNIILATRQDVQSKKNVYDETHEYGATYTLKSGTKSDVTLRERPKSLGKGWLAAFDYKEKTVPITIELNRTPDNETLYHLAYSDLYKEHLLQVANRGMFVFGRVLCAVGGGYTVGVCGHTMFLPEALWWSKAPTTGELYLFTIISYDEELDSFVVSQTEAYKKAYQMWTHRYQKYCTPNTVMSNNFLKKVLTKVKSKWLMNKSEFPNGR